MRFLRSGLLRMHIRKRQAEGIAATKGRGVKFWRPRVTLPENFDRVHARWRRKEISLKEAAKACNLAESTFFDKAREVERRG